jgi:hypothetical protein
MHGASLLGTLFFLVGAKDTLPVRPEPVLQPTKLKNIRSTYISAWPSAFLASADPWPPSLLFLPFKFLSLSLFFSLSRLCQCVTGFLPTFLLSCVRAVLLVINCLLLYQKS